MLQHMTQKSGLVWQILNINKNDYNESNNAQKSYSDLLLKQIQVKWKRITGNCRNPSTVSCISFDLKLIWMIQLILRRATTPHNTTQHHTTQHNTTPHHTTQRNATPHNTMPHNTKQHDTTQHNTKQHNTTHLSGLVLYEKIIMFYSISCRITFFRLMRSRTD